MYDETTVGGNLEILAQPDTNEIPANPENETQRQLGMVMLEGFVPMVSGEDFSSSDIRKRLEQVIVGQDEAIDAIATAIDRVEVRRSSDKRPMATFAFLGPTGTGKSEIGKTLAEITGGDNPNLVKIDCSNFSHGHEVTILTGSPPSYVGDKQEALLSKRRVEDQPGTVIMFDEVEKGSPGLYNLMLQIMEDGQLTINNGDVVSFRNTILILTSNLGAREMNQRLSTASLGFGTRTEQRDKTALEEVATKAFKDFFSPEFVNRLTEVVVFQPHTEDNLLQIARNKIRDANRDFIDKDGIMLSLSDATLRHIVELASTEKGMGARPLVRLLDKFIYSSLGQYKVAGNLAEGTHVKVFHESEVPEEFKSSTQNSLLFTSRYDSSVVKKPAPVPAVVAPTVPFLPPELEDDSLEIKDDNK